MPEDEWWNAFFAGVWPRIQGDGFPVERTAAECDLISDLLQIRPRARVLDIPWGTGRHSVELARRGFRSLVFSSALGPLLEARAV
jgi:hypothetical protein